MFTTSIAAAEAFRTMGYEQARADIVAVIEQLKPVWAANAADDEEDDDGNGVADVDELTPPQLLQRKAFLVITTLKEPERIQNAIRSLYAAFLAVLATLRLEFAQTTAMAMGVADMAKKPLERVLKPPIAAQLPESAHHWISPTIDAVVRLAAIAAAWCRARSDSDRRVETAHTPLAVPTTLPLTGPTVREHACRRRAGTFSRSFRGFTRRCEAASSSRRASSTSSCTTRASASSCAPAVRARRDRSQTRGRRCAPNATAACTSSAGPARPPRPSSALLRPPRSPPPSSPCSPLLAPLALLARCSARP
jgi:hypothetical protein